jgi:HSP20 family protein
MAESETKVPVKTGEKAPSTVQPWHPFEDLRREIERVFNDFGAGFWGLPFRRSVFGTEPFWRAGQVPWGTTPVVDVAEREKEYEIAAELPGLDEKDIEVKPADNVLTIKGEKKEEKEEKKKDYYLSERRYGSFQRSFRVPEGVDADKIAATFKKGVLSITLPKSPEAMKKEKKITVKSG